ncbi:MAG: hypothetical protein ACRD5W_06730, partial [Candidatus Acidiferrales bacterium]
MCDLILHGEDVGEFLIQRFAPQRGAIAHAEQVDVDPNAVAGALNRTIQHRINLKLAGGLECIHLHGGIFA